MTTEFVVYVAAPRGSVGRELFRFLRAELAGRIGDHVYAVSRLPIVVNFVWGWDETSGQRSHARQTTLQIHESDAVLALCVPDSGQRRHYCPWVSADMGVARGAGKHMAVLATGNLVDQSALPYVGDDESVVKQVPRADVKGGKPPKRVHDDLVRWIGGWIQDVEDVKKNRGHWNYQLYDKTVDVYPNGFGLVRLRVQIEVTSATRKIEHAFGMPPDQRADPIPQLDVLSKNYASHWTSRPAQTDLFRFLDLGSHIPVKAEAMPYEDLGEDRIRRVERAFKGFSKEQIVDFLRSIKVVPSGQEDLLLPGTYHYELCYGLEQTFEQHFKEDHTQATPDPAYALRGGMTVNFICPQDRDIAIARNLEVRHSYGGEDTVDALGAGSVSTRRETTTGVCYEFRSALHQTFPQDMGKFFTVRWRQK